MTWSFLPSWRTVCCWQTDGSSLPKSLPNPPRVACPKGREGSAENQSFGANRHTNRQRKSASPRPRTIRKQILSAATLFAVCGLVVSATAQSSNLGEAAGVTFETRLTQANPATLQALSGERGPRQRGRPEPSAGRAFATPDRGQVFVLRKQFRPGEFERAQRNPNAFERMTTLRLQAPLGREALYLVGSRERVPTVENPAGRRPTGDAAVGVSANSAGPERDFGLLLRFLAVGLPDGGLRIRVRPTVTSPEFGQSTEKNGRFVPAIKTRGIDTYVDVDPGQTFAITGLIGPATADRLDKLDKTKRQVHMDAILDRRRTKPNHELVILVTPHLTQAQSQPAE